ncbi:FecR family protein [Lutibacter sp. A64]|uniref:FecR family protein n=1 Tax=Lutibacter sp. A64 TaxID=2918526 RepID=UPI001F0615ED|nr:FecR family protein [Lutibacter sp. A64]UMB52497.1 FecR family protein [Lutibacter sp. A64]
MTKKLTTYRIAELIYKSVSQTINSTEEKELQVWLKNKSNKDLFEKIIKSDAIEQKILLYKQSNKQAVYNRLSKKIALNQQKNNKKNKFATVLKYAAILIICLTVGNFIYQNNFNETVITKNAVKQIKPGYKKATLILSDGSSVDLESTKNTVIASTNTTQIKNTNNILQYNTVDKAPKTKDKTTPEEVTYNTLYVPTGGMYQIELPDGTNVWINSESSLKYPIKFTGNKRIVELTGEAYFEVTKDNSKEFIVETNSASITVLGTKFNVSSYNTDNYFSSTLVEGKIKLTSLINTKKSIIMLPGERGKIDNGKSSITINNVDSNLYTAWIEGKFYFEKENLDRILTKIGRWYNIDIEFDDPSIKKQTFTGVALKNKPVDYLLKMISETANLKYNINKNRDNDKYKLIISKN